MDEIYSILDQTFEWDRMKAARNAVKHGVRFPEAASVFFDADALFEQDRITRWMRRESLA